MNNKVSNLKTKLQIITKQRNDLMRENIHLRRELKESSFFDEDMFDLDDWEKRNHVHIR